jgi:hypothetical protein
MAIALVSGLTACSVHPLPEDVSRASTFDIVHRIRCEVWEGLSEFQPSDPRVQSIVNRTTIGYDFDFIISENSAAAEGKLEFKRPSFKGDGSGFVLDLSAGASKARTNTRSFRILEGLWKVKDDCSKAHARPNLTYPIAGSTGMAEFIRTYMRLEMLTDLPAAKEDDVVFSDKLDFTTKLSAGAMPTLEVSSVAGSFRLTKASIFGSANRDDTHSVTVSLSRDPGDVDPKSMAAKRERLEWVSKAAITDARTLRRLIQKATDAPTRVVLELQRRRNVEEDARVVARVLGVPVTVP